MTDETIKKVLEEDPEQGMEYIVEHYTGLLWSVCAKLLPEPEDIKDCVNETFADFFWQREKFDPEKGSLSGYLAIIARRLALKKRQDNIRRAGEYIEPVDERDPIHTLEDRAEIENYLQTLEPIDEQIIRMKYYGGMTGKEIAASLGLPYETVKKRHQRSLKKLRKAMTIGLIGVLSALVLAACAYVVLHYFGIVPGYGVNTDPDSGVYVMESESITVDSEEFHLTLTDIWWMNGVLRLEGDVVLYERENPEQTSTCDSDYGQLTVEGLENAQSGVASHSVRDGGLSERFSIMWKGDLPEGTKDTLALTLKWDNGAVCTVELKRARNEVSYEQAGYFDVTENEGGLLAVPRLENGELIVAIYPLSEGEYTIHPMLTSGPYTSFENQCRDITATAADGTVLVGTMAYGNSFSSNTYYEWNFGPAQAGEYTLRVPFVYQTLVEGTQSDVIIRDVLLHDAACDMDISFPFQGGEVRLTRQAPDTDYVYFIDADTEEFRAMNEIYAQYRWWNVDMEIVSTTSERTAMEMGFMLINGPEVHLEVNGSTIGLPTGMNLSRTEPGPNGTQRLIGMKIGTYQQDMVQLRLDPGQIGYRWNREFTIPFEVS